MARKTTVQIDTRQFQRALKDFAAFVQDDSGAVVLDQATLMAADGMAATPPFGQGKKRGNTKAAEAQGEKAVERSVTNAMSPLVEKGTYGWLRRARQTNNREEVNEFYRKTGSNKRAQAFSEQLHTGNRNRDGRVFKRRGNVMATDSDIAALQSYLSEPKSHVGTYKAAFGSMIERLQGPNPQGIKNPAKTRVPAWISKHNGRAKSQLGADLRIQSQKNRGLAVTMQTRAHRMLEWAWPRIIDKRRRLLEKMVRDVVNRDTKRINQKYRTR